MSEHPHLLCKQCRRNYYYNNMLASICLLAILFVSAERAIALAILIAAFTLAMRPSGTGGET